jgi:hypothetical protein
MSESIRFCDGDADDAFCDIDGQVDWGHVEKLAKRYEEVESILDPNIRLEEAKKLVGELSV